MARADYILIKNYLRICPGRECQALKYKGNASFVVVENDGSVSQSGSCRSSSNPGNNGQLLLVRSQANEIQKTSHNCIPMEVLAIILACLISETCPMCLIQVFMVQPHTS